MKTSQFSISQRVSLHQFTKAGLGVAWGGKIEGVEVIHFSEKTLSGFYSEGFWSTNFRVVIGLIALISPLSLSPALNPLLKIHALIMIMRRAISEDLILSLFYSSYVLSLPLSLSHSLSCLSSDECFVFHTYVSDDFHLYLYFFCLVHMDPTS